jgi:transposase
MRNAAFGSCKDPRFLASSLYRKKPERIMALLMVMTVCLLVYAALEYRIRQTLTAHQATFPNQQGHPGQHPTARGVVPYCVGIHLRRVPGQGAFVLNLNDQHQQLLRLLRRSYEAFYS